MIAGKECVRCGIRYCSAACQKADWKSRHKDHCELKDIRRTEIVFGLHHQRIKDYTAGKSSFDRYYSAALLMVYKEDYPLHENPTESCPCYNKYEDAETGRAVTVLEDHEELDFGCVLRGGKIYIPNHNIPKIALGEEEAQNRIAAGLPVKEGVELVPLNENIQHAYWNNNVDQLTRCMRKALYAEQRASLLMMRATFSPGMGYAYGNPVFLNLKNTLAYEDYIQKNFNFGDLKFPMNLCCSVLYPEFKFSMRTGNVADDQKVLDFASDEKFIARERIAPSMAAAWATIFDENLMKQEEAEERDAFTQRSGESAREHNQRLGKYLAKLKPHMYTKYDLAVHCSESLAICPADQSCYSYAARRSGGHQDLDQGGEGDSDDAPKEEGDAQGEVTQDAEAGAKMGAGDEC